MRLRSIDEDTSTISHLDVVVTLQTSCTKVYLEKTANKYKALYAKLPINGLYRLILSEKSMEFQLELHLKWGPKRGESSVTDLYAVDEIIRNYTEVTCVVDEINTKFQLARKIHKKRRTLLNPLI